MSLRERVEEAIDKGLDPKKFEQCAVQLLSRQYRKVTPVEHGSDGGRDGDILEPISDDPNSRGRILATTSDMLANLKSSYKTWQKLWDQKREFRIDQLVLVTSRPLSDTKRKNIERFAASHDLPLPHIYARDWLVNQLLHNAEVRLHLTGIKGRLKALSVNAPSRSSSTTLRGREEAMSALRTALGENGDVLVIGPPGVGKSRLVDEVFLRAHYVETQSAEHLHDDLYKIQPEAVVLDDAHLHADLLERLSRIRDEEDLNFRIIAVTWPDSSALTTSMLRAVSTIQVNPLLNDALNAVIEDQGVKRFHNRNYILERAAGRPGWAVLLARLLMTGNRDELLAGKPLLEQVERVMTAIAGSPQFREALAWIAALGQASLEDLEIIASTVGMSYSVLLHDLERFAQGGMVERHGDRWSMLAPVRPLLAGSTFFGPKKSRNWSSVKRYFPSDGRLIRMVLEVCLRFPETDARSEAQAWASSLKPASLSHGDLRYLVAFAQLDEESADLASTLVRQALRLPESPSPDGVETALRRWPLHHAHAEVLKAALLSSASKPAVATLLDLGLADDRERHQYPEHPMRHIKTAATELDPDFGDVDDRRSRTTAAMIRWFKSSPKSTAHVRIFTEALSYLFDPELHGVWMDPGKPDSVTWSSGVVAASTAGDMRDRWAAVELELLGAMASLDVESVDRLCELFEKWIHISAGHPIMTVTIPAELQESAGSMGRRIQESLSKLSSMFPAIPIRVNRPSNGGEIAAAAHQMSVTDLRLEKFVGRRDPWDYWDDAEQERHQELRSLASELGQLGPAEGVREYTRLADASKLLKHPTGEGLLERDLADQFADLNWLREAVALKAVPLVAPMLRVCRKQRLDISSMLPELDSTTELRHKLLHTLILEEAEQDDLSRRVLGSMTEKDISSSGGPYFTQEATPPLLSLLGHDSQVIRSWAALSLAPTMYHEAPRLEGDEAQAWRQAIIHTPLRSGNVGFDSRLESSLVYFSEHEPELCRDWLTHNLESICKIYKGIAPTNIDLLDELFSPLPANMQQQILEHATSLALNKTTVFGLFARFSD